MNSESDRLKEIFGQALQIKPAAEREAYLARACQSEPELRSQVDSLLQAHEKAGDFLGQTMRLAPTEFEPETLGTMIGRYKLLEKIGEGGFGVVYMAEQQEPVQRKVALKIIKPGMDTREVIARFEAERQALALMDHPNIARVLDGGATDAQRPYFVMELVRGIPITDYCDQAKLSTSERLPLFIKVCQAVQHAHQKGIIHRDIKPSNVLVTQHDGEPAPKVIDFGVAKALGQKLTEKTLFTAFRQMIGTPAYMSPEQAEMSGLDIDTRSDIYSLGVLLYELLTSVTPFDRDTLAKAGLDEIRRMIRETEPPKPSTRLRTLGAKLPEVAEHRRTEPAVLNRLVRGDLDWIVMKCLEKDRQRRYETANGLARDVDRYINHEMVLASPPTLGYKVRKFSRRNRKMLASIAVVALALLLGSTVSVWQAVRATRARHNEANARLEEAKQRARAEGNERKARASEDAATQGEREASAKFYAADMVATQQALNEGDLGLARRYLSVHQPTGPKEDLRGFEWRYFWNQARGQALHRLQAHSNLVYAVAFSPNSRWLASADWDGRVIVWDVPSRSKAHEWPGNGTMAFSVAFSSDGRVLGIGRGNEWSLWDVTSMNDPRLIHRAKAREARIKFIPDSSRFLLGQGVYLYGEDGGFTELWEYAPETKLVRRFPDSGGQVAVSADGKFAVTGRYADQIKRWDVATGALLEEFSYPADLKHIECSPRDEWFLTISGMRRAQSWANHRSAPATLAFNKDSDCWDASVSPDGHLVAVAATDQIVHIFDSSTWVEIASLKGHESEVFCVAFSPDGGLLASGGKDESVLLWRTESLRKTKIISGMEPSMWSPSPALSSDGRYIAFRSTKGRVEVWNLDDQEPILSLDGPMYPLAFSPEGRRLVTLDPTLTVASWNLESRQKEASLPLSDEPTQFRPAVLSPDGRLLAIADIQGVIGVYDLIGRKLATRFRAHPARIFGLAFSPDGRLLASCSLDKTTRLWETKAFRPIAEFQGHKHHVYWVAFSPDGQSIATASIDNKAKIWEVQSQRELATLAGHMAGVVRLAFDPQGKTLATAGDDNKVKLWNLRTYREVAAFPVDAHAEWLSFSADGQKLLMACGGKLNILEAPVPPSEPAPSANLGLIPWSLVPEALKTGTKEKP